MARVVVTGGAGFIGSHLVDALVTRGDQVSVIDHMRKGHAGNLESALAAGTRLFKADVCDVTAMLTAFRSARPEVVFHLAAQIDVRRSVTDPSLDAHVNIGGTAAVLEAARDAGVGRVVLASTAGVYGDPPRLPTAEDSPIRPLSPYGAGKAAAETYMELFSRLHGISTLSLRMANVYGPRQNPHGEAGVIAIFAGAAAEGRPVTLFGDGVQTRDFVYVGDVVAAFVAAGGADVRGALNVSTGTETALIDLARELGVEARPGPGRLGEIRRSCLDPSAAAHALGWRASMPLREGLAETVAAVPSAP
jgi:UDP-glucose 4-epimerase